MFLIAGLSKYRAAIEAGYSHATAMHVAARIECNPGVRRALQRWLDREGISDRKLEQLAEAQ